MLVIDISQTIPPIARSFDHTGAPYRHAQTLVRLHSTVLGVVKINSAENGVTALEHANIIWQTLGDKINAHLCANGLCAISTLTPNGIAFDSSERAKARAAFLAQAPFVSVIVCTHNRAVSLARCLRSLLKLNYPHFEIIVVDNAPSNDDAQKMIKNDFAQETRVRYVCEARVGKSCAANTGAMLARGALLAFTDDDVEVDAHWLTELAMAFRADQNVGCVTGLILPAELETQAQFWQEEFGGYNRANNFNLRIFDLHDLSQRRKDEPLYPYTAGNFGAGANLCFDRTVFMRLGGFDPALGAGTLTLAAEDSDLLFRTVANGYSIVQQPSAFLFHHQYRDYEHLKLQLYGYGHGFSAHLINCVVRRPSSLLDFISMIPYTGFYLFNPKSPKHAKKTKAFPPELATIELRGMLVGWFQYLRSRWHYRHVQRPAEGIVTSSPTNIVFHSHISSQTKSV
jgi:GT2 family glycosyltransferase